MKVPRGIQTIVSLGLVAYGLRAVGRVGVDRNVRALADHLGCSTDDARRLYFLARRDGYGSAYRQVFPSGQPRPQDPPTLRVDADATVRGPRRDQPIHH